MGIIRQVLKSRRDYVCSKCRRTIPKGSSYYRGELNFMPSIIRCSSCGLKWYEVTTSDYIRDVGAIVEDWQESFAVQDGVWEEIASNLEEIMDGCSERLENMPEQLQEESEAGQRLQERVDGLESATDELRDCSMEEFLQAGYEELTEEDQEEIAAEGDVEDFESWYEAFWKKDTELARKWQEYTQNAITDRIDEILEGVPCE